MNVMLKVRSNAPAVSDTAPGLKADMKKRCVFVGPAAERYRGGIAQFSSRLAVELSVQNEVRHLSWSRLYPSMLISRELRAGERQERRGMDVDYKLDIMNQRTWKECADHILDFRPDFTVLTWSHPIHALVYSSMLHRLRRFPGRTGTVVFICHNVLPHESFPGAAHLTRFCLSRADRLITHSTACAEKARALLREEQQVRTLFHPLHDEFVVNRAHARAAWAPPAVLNLLFFGTIRRYKGLDVLLQALPEILRRYENVHLTIAGEPFFQGNRLLQGIFGEDILPTVRRLGLAKHVSLELRYIPDAELPGLFYRADLVVFPYRAASQSGSLSLAYSFGKPVIASRTGGFLDSVREGDTGYLAAPEDPQALAEAILRFVERPIASAEVCAATQRMSWANYAAGLLQE